MNKRLLFSIQYTALCIFLTFLLITVFGKHYQLDARFLVPCLAALPGAFLAGWLLFARKKRFWHLRIGLFALLFTFVFCWAGFLFVRLSAPGSVFQVSLLKALLDAWLSLLDGMLIMIPAFVLLVYVARPKKPHHEFHREEQQDTQAPETKN
ncbi:MAG TPA: hypothetical protein VFL76_04735 [Edaphocola sp.]|nr:hypothetical protein [Edaphocola sp.]